MLKYLNILAALVLSATPLIAQSKYGLGRPALPQEVAAWDHDVRPGGIGLPPGSGDVLTGEAVFADKCAACHGDFAEGVGNWPKLAGGDGTLANKDPVKTVGSYWPYLSTVCGITSTALCLLVMRKPSPPMRSMPSSPISFIRIIWWMRISPFQMRISPMLKCSMRAAL